MSGSHTCGPGVVYLHYKGGRYVVVGTAERHTHNGDIDVVYYSLTHGHLVTRPLRRDSRDEKSWTDVVVWPDGVRRERFVVDDGTIKV